MEGLLTDLSGVIKKASEEMGPGASKEELAAHAVKACCCGMWMLELKSGSQSYQIVGDDTSMYV